MEWTKVTFQFTIDGNQWMATFDDFENLHESPAGFGSTPGVALAALLADVAFGDVGEDHPQHTQYVNFLKRPAVLGHDPHGLFDSDPEQ